MGSDLRKRLYMYTWHIYLYKRFKYIGNSKYIP